MRFMKSSTGLANILVIQNGRTRIGSPKRVFATRSSTLSIRLQGVRGEYASTMPALSRCIDFRRPLRRGWSFVRRCRPVAACPGSQEALHSSRWPLLRDHRACGCGAHSGPPPAGPPPAKSPRALAKSQFLSYKDVIHNAASQRGGLHVGSDHRRNERHWPCYRATVCWRRGAGVSRLSAG